MRQLLGIAYLKRHLAVFDPYREGILGFDQASLEIDRLPSELTIGLHITKRLVHLVIHEVLILVVDDILLHLFILVVIEHGRHWH